jgi:hypothetical protein
MSDASHTIFKSRPEGLARILALDEAASELWEPQEMQAIWKHQLRAPIYLDLSTVESARAMDLEHAPHLKPFLNQSFGELITHPQPPVELLTLTKDFAKHALGSAEDAQLKDIASALYCISYAAGMTRCSIRIGSLSDAELQRVFRWALGRSWLDEASKKVISEALETLPKGSKS